MKKIKIKKEIKYALAQPVPLSGVLRQLRTLSVTGTPHLCCCTNLCMRVYDMYEMCTAWISHICNAVHISYNLDQGVHPTLWTGNIFILYSSYTPVLKTFTKRRASCMSRNTTVHLTYPNSTTHTLYAIIMYTHILPVHLPFPLY